MKRRAVAFIDLQSDPKDPKLKIVSPRAFKSDLKDFKHGDKVWLTVESFKRDPSTEQRGLLHWYCDLLAKETYMEPEDFKSMMKLKFLQRAKLDENGKYISDPETGEVFLYIPSTESLPPEEYYEFTEKIRLWSEEFLGYILPDPDPEHKNKKI